jgi:glycosyltransferase involved in cell wall biosynthesis
MTDMKTTHMRATEAAPAARSADAQPAQAAGPAAPAELVAPAGATVADGDGAPYVTIVLPCFNEASHVLQEIDRITVAMRASGFTYELMCIDDASTDGTLEVLREGAARYPEVRVVPFRRNGGSGTARRIGTQQARGQIVVWTDADMTYENERIPELVGILRDDPSYDQVVGARTTEQGTHKWARVPAKWLIRKIAERLSNQRIPDLNSGLRAFRRSVALPYLRLLPPGFSCVTTITMAFLANQHDIKYVPTSYAKRAGTSKFHFARDAYRYILQVLRMVVYFDPLKVLLPPALWMLAIGLLKGIVDMARHPFYFPASTVLLVVSSIMIGSLALLADLVVRSRDAV